MFLHFKNQDLRGIFVVWITCFKCERHEGTKSSRANGTIQMQVHWRLLQLLTDRFPNPAFPDTSLSMQLQSIPCVRCRYFILYFFHCTQTTRTCTYWHTLHLPSSSAASGNEANDGQTNPLPALRCCTLTKYKYKKAVVHIQKDTNRDTSPAFPILIIINDIYTMYIIH